MSWSPDYVTVSELKAYLRIDDSNTDDDTELGLAITAASRAIDLTCNRQFGSVSQEARIYSAEWDRQRCLVITEIDDLMAVTGTSVSVDDAVTTEYTLRPYNAPANGKPWTQIVFESGVGSYAVEGNVEITANWGWDAVPDVVREACLVQSARFFRRRESPMGVESDPSFSGSFGVSRFVEPDVALMLRTVKRWWAVAR